MTEAATSDLAARQAAVIAALVAGGQLPAGFDQIRMSIARRALLVKRAGQVATAWPLLAASFGADWPSRFTTWADGRPPLGSLRDGWDFVRALAAAGELPERALIELAEREATWRYDGRSVPRRRWRLSRSVRALWRSIRLRTTSPLSGATARSALNAQEMHSAGPNTYRCGLSATAMIAAAKQDTACGCA